MTGRSKFTLSQLQENVSFPGEEEKVLKYWLENDCFRESIRKSQDRPAFTFYDGPPFATGLPHYGHVLAGTIKDIVTRWAYQTGHQVERRFGWDCHGLPIEFEIEKRLKIKTKQEVLELGIAKYNAECRGIVMTYAKEWERIMTRFGRWIDFENDYKTMNLTFMESVWWVFKQLHEKGLIYRGVKVMPYSTGCTTPLSNFEANMNYKDTSDPSIVIAFPLEDQPEVSILVWTTTPWTLPSNLALCVHPDLVYLKIKDNQTGALWILAEARLSQIYPPKKGKPYEILEKYIGKDLVGKSYVPLWDFFLSGPWKSNGAWKVVADTYVTSDSGTGVVHQAPAYGEDDHRVCLKHGIIDKSINSVLCLVDEGGCFTGDIPWRGQYIKAAEDAICASIKEKGRLISKNSEVHSYPFCWRSQTPLIYKACAAWFVEVEKIKENLMARSMESHWVPEFVQTKRFSNWLADAKDWCISRSRYWGTPLPVWHSDDWEEIVVVGSVQELEELTGKKFTDIHRDFVDDVTIPSRMGKGQLHRVEEVLDCWFESGSMPYAQNHYPFENKEKFAQGFPADFIAEGLDQTRGWFYTLMILSTALFDKPAFKNVIVNGLVLAADRKKMSKSLKNYPDPMDVVNHHSADAVRLYLINSPVVRAEPMAFKEEGVKEVVKVVLLPLWNSMKFFLQNYERFQSEGHGLPSKLNPTNTMDKWILASGNHLIEYVRAEMAGFRLYTVVPSLLRFLENLTNWYVRMNRKRLKGGQGVEDCGQALATLHTVLMIAVRLLAPFAPFITENMYQHLSAILPEDQREESVHYSSIPEPDVSLLNPVIERQVERMQKVVDITRIMREANKISLKMPIREIIVLHHDQEYVDDVRSLEYYILDELNCLGLKCPSDQTEYITLSADINMGVAAKKLKGDTKKVSEQLKSWKQPEVEEFMRTGKATILGHELEQDDVRIVRNCKPGIENYDTHADSEVVVLMDKRSDDNILMLGLAREFVNRVQKLRKTAKLTPGDPVRVYYHNIEKDPLIESTLQTQEEYISTSIRVTWQNLESHKPETEEIIREETELNQKKFLLIFAKP